MRRDKRPKRAKNVMLCVEQYAALEIIAANAPVGEPSVSSLIRTAVDHYIAEQIRKNPDLEVAIQKATLAGQAENVVPLRSLPDEKGGG